MLCSMQQKRLELNLDSHGVITLCVKFSIWQTDQMSHETDLEHLKLKIKSSKY